MDLDKETIPFWYDVDEYTPRVIIYKKPPEPIYLIEKDGRIYIKNFSTIVEELDLELPQHRT